MTEFNPGPGWREVLEPADAGDGDEVRWRSSDDSAVRYWVSEIPAELRASREQSTDRDVLAAAWDDGNAVGLDGWVGPNRGTEPDSHAIRMREQFLDRWEAVS